MKRITLAVAALSLVSGFTSAFRPTTAQTKQIKQVQVTAQTIASQPAGKAYIIDLASGGTVYTIADNIDYSRVRVRL